MDVGGVAAVTGDEWPMVVWARVALVVIADSLRRDKPGIAVAVLAQASLDATVRTKGKSLEWAQKSKCYLFVFQDFHIFSCRSHAALTYQFTSFTIACAVMVFLDHCV
jgi:hypothetical protein